MVEEQHGFRTYKLQNSCHRSNCYRHHILRWRPAIRLHNTGANNCHDMESRCSHRCTNLGRIVRSRAARCRHHIRLDVSICKHCHNRRCLLCCRHHTVRPVPTARCRHHNTPARYSRHFCSRPAPFYKELYNRLRHGDYCRHILLLHLACHLHTKG